MAFQFHVQGSPGMAEWGWGEQARRERQPLAHLPKCFKGVGAEFVFLARRLVKDFGVKDVLV